MKEQLYNLKNELLAQIDTASSLSELENLRSAFLGKNGKFTLLLKQLAFLSQEEKPLMGKLANDFKKLIEKSLTYKKDNLIFKDHIDNKSSDTVLKLTLPGEKIKLGHLHPQTLILAELIDLFKTIGYETADGPEIETDYYNFERLNIPKYHPARDSQQTLWLSTFGTNRKPGEIILRTQTSSMQGRIMESSKLPLRVIVPGKCFRYDQVDASHGFEFWQLEGFLIDKNVHLTDLFGTLEYVLKKIMGENTKIRFACTNFPFVEPGVDTYMECTVCFGKGCSFCKKSGWSEIMPAGMIHPHVLKSAKINSDYNGFAFAIGLSRLVTLRYKMDDLRLLTNPDLRIINQF